MKPRSCVYKEKKWFTCVDVELDQIMTNERVSLSNICAYFLTEFLERGPTSFSLYLQSILLLDGDVEETSEQRKVVLKRNLKELK